MRRLTTSVSLAFLLLLSSAVLLFAQRDLGTLTGTVTDPTGAAIPNATITITNTATGVSTTTTTTGTGTFTRPALVPGTYTVSATAPGFEKGQQTGIVVTPGATQTVNIPLQVGNAATTVEVTSQAPLLQTENPAIGEQLSSTQVSQLPLGGQRIFTYLARLSPGVVPAEPGARDAATGGFSANGVRSTGENNFLLNGIDNNVNDIDFLNQTSFVIGPSVDAIANEQVITNGASAEYGRAAGGILDIDLKSGTNQVHGNLFEFLQNTDLNANRWENNLTGTPRNPLKQNQYGGDIGFPIIKNKLFMFGDYQGTRLRTAGGVVNNLGYGGFYTIPTPAMIKGDFSRLLGGAVGNINGQTVLANQLFDPTTTICSSGCVPGTLSALSGVTPVYTRAPYTNNQLPTSEFDPAAAKIMSLYPAPNQPVRAGNYPQNDYYTVTPGDLNTDQGDGRVDYHLNDSNSIFGSLSWSNTSKANGMPLPGALEGGSFYGAAETDLGRDAMLSWTHIFSPTIVNEARVGFSRLVTLRTGPNAQTDEFAAMGIGGYDPTHAAANNGGLPQTGLGHYSQIGANDWLPTKEYSNEWDFIENLSIVHGNHSFKMGGEFRPLHFPFFQVPFPHGEMNFSRTETSYPSTLKDSGPNGTFTSDTGDEMASYLLGAMDNAQISTTNFISSTKQAYATYFQDTWKVTSKLTLNLGARYELFSPIGEQFGRQSNFVLTDMTLFIPRGPNQNAPLPPNFNTPYTSGGFTFPAKFPNVQVSRGQVSPYLIPWDKTDIGPRLGFAYNIVPKTVIRGFFGMFYGGEENQGGNPNRGESVPFNESPQLNRPAGVGQFQPDPFLGNGNPIGDVTVGYPTTVFTTFPVSSLQMRELATDFRNPMVQEWNFTVEQELPWQMAFSLGYEGNHQAHQLLQPDFNNCPLVFTTNSALNCNAIRPEPDIGSISGTATWGVGNYNAMTAELIKRTTAGLDLQIAYTYGHALADSGTTLSGSSGLYLPDPSNQMSEYSSASWDIRHNFTAAFNYQIPFGRGKQYGASLNRVTQTLLGNWQVNGILTLRTGVPYTLRAAGCQDVGGGGCSPEYLGPPGGYNAAPTAGRTPSAWFNTSYYGPPAPLSLGNAGLQSMTGPPTRTLDFSLFKDFDFTERWKFELRGEAFNIANTPQFNTPDNNLQDANFGKITSTQAGTARTLQIAAQLNF
jgi:hypothetical protein